MKPIVITLFVAFIATLLSPQSSMAQTDSTYVGTDSTYVDVDSTSVIIFEPAADSDDYWHADVIDSPEAEQKGKRDWKHLWCRYRCNSGKTG